MTRAEEQLADIGFGKRRAERSCWSVVRLDRPTASISSAESSAEPACSAALLRWRDLLARNPRPSPYRISRA